MIAAELWNKHEKMGSGKMKRNVELLEKTIQHIEDYPEDHDQTRWFTECGTASCFAGWAWNLAGRNYDNFLAYTNLSLCHFSAQSLLGLTTNEALILFYEFNTRDMLKLMVKDLVNGDDLRDREEYKREVWD